MIRITFIAAILFLSVWASPTLETMKKESRVALVIGNSDYDEHPLERPVQNAREVRDFLQKNGFYVYYGENLDKKNFIRLLRKFNKKMHPGGIGLVYFSGHIVQTKGKNYLVPVENGIIKEAMLPRQCVSLKSIYSGMQRPHNRLNIIILDGAKEAPFGSLFTMKRAAMAPVAYLEDFTTFISAHPDTISDSDSFTRDFLHFAERKGVELRELRSDLTYQRQQDGHPKPHINLAKNRPFYFTLPDVLPAADELAYEQIRNSTSKTEVEAFLRKYPKSSFVEKAQQQLKSIDEEEAQRKVSEAKAAQEALSSESSRQKTVEKAVSEQENSASGPDAESQRKAIGITISKPGSDSNTSLQKPKEGEERHILLQ